MKVCHSYNRQQLNDIYQNSQDARISNLTQYYPQQNQQYDQSYNYSQQRYNAVNFQKNVHFEDETNSKQTHDFAKKLKRLRPIQQLSSHHLWYIYTHLSLALNWGHKAFKGSSVRRILSHKCLNTTLICMFFSKANIY